MAIPADAVPTQRVRTGNMTDQHLVRRIVLRNFRGIVGPMGVEFPAPGAPGSVLFILGDNGTGKSSICDSIEFATRGVISRRLQGGEKSRREVQNLSDKKAPPSVWLEVASGEHFVRGARRGRDWAWPAAPSPLQRDEPLPGFEFAPVVIRREAVESFWRIPAASRLDYFWDYLKPPGVQVRTPGDERTIAEHAATLRNIATARRQLLQILPKKGWPAEFVLPTRSVVAAGTLHRALKKHLDGQGKGRVPSERDRAVIQSYVDSLSAEERLRHDAAQAELKLPRDTRELRVLLAGIGPRVAGDFFGIYGEDWIRDIRFDVGANGSLDITLIRDQGRPLRPEEVLSEAGLDILSLIIAVELNVAAADLGQARILLFDDVFQSVDAIFRKRIVDHLAGLLRGWQLVFTLHERLWLEIAKRAFDDAKFGTSVIQLRSGGFARTPVLTSVQTGPLRDLEAEIAAGGSSVAIAGLAGRTLEGLAERLSTFLGVTIRRKEGDRYEMNDLWPAVKGEIDKSAETKAKVLAATMEHSTFLRNRVGAHANDWADGLSDAEAAESAEHVMDLWRVFLCPSCGRFGKREALGSGSWRMRFGCCVSPTDSTQPGST